MAIQWFPGHMNQARKKVAETLAKVDVVIEVLDARLPRLSSNPMIETLRLGRQRPALKILNKTDLADPAVTKRWAQWFADQPKTAVLMLDQANKLRDSKKIAALCLQLAPHRAGFEKPMRALIAGIPNVGKSTLINTLVRRKVADVADQPAVTKSQQRVELPDGMVLIDTPGLMWPKIESMEAGLKIALSGAIGRNAYDAEEVATFALEWLAARYPQGLQQRYKLEDCSGTGDELFERVARRRGAMLPGGLIDRQKISELVLTDFRSGQLGRISLERPEDPPPMPDLVENPDIAPLDDDEA